MSTAPYQAQRESASHFTPVRGLRLHWRSWGDPSLAAPGRPPLVLLHGWMDISASFQFVVDALRTPRWIVAPDWRGFGLSESSGNDTYWHPDYLADLDALLDLWSPDAAVDVVGHSMGGNVAMAYAGIRPQRVRRLVNIEGFGLPATQPEEAAARFAQWLDALKEPAKLRPHATLAEVTQRLMFTHPRLPADKAAWLAPHWAGAAGDGPTPWRLRADPVHKRIHPQLYRADEAVALYRAIAAPVLWLEGDETPMLQRWQGRYTPAEHESRLAAVRRLERTVIAGAGHMLQHDQPERVAESVERFLDAPA